MISVTFPELDLSHLNVMMDSTGILQHATSTVPNFKEGYSLDDNARSLIFGILLHNYSDQYLEEAKKISHISASFLWYAFNDSKLTFRNFLSYDRHWLEEAGSQDSMGRALWALGFTVGNSQIEGITKMAQRLFRESIISTKDFTHLRSKTFALIGICEYLKNCNEIEERLNLKQIIIDFSKDLMDSYSKYQTPEWKWFEEGLSYCNAKIPQALLMAGEALEDQKLVDVGLESLTWLLDNQKTEDCYFNPIGHVDFHTKGTRQSKEGQQPVEAKAMIQACLKAFSITKDSIWYDEAVTVFRWFMGNNILKVPVYDVNSGGCNDGMEGDRISENQGAESTLSFLISLVELKLTKV